MSKQHEQSLILFRKASADLTLVEEVISSDRVGDDILGFHCQQAAEKLPKSLLVAAGITFPRTHNLRLLIDLLGDGGQPLPPDLADLDTLTPFGTLYRYEDIPSEQSLDRGKALDLVNALKSYTGQVVGQSSSEAAGRSD